MAKGAKNIHWGKDSARRAGPLPVKKKSETRSFFSHHILKTSKWIKDLKVSPKTIKLGENMSYVVFICSFSLNSVLAIFFWICLLRWWNSSWAISNPKRSCGERAALNTPANMENSAVATGLEKVSFHSNPKKRQCQRKFKLLHNCTHFTL